MSTDTTVIVGASIGGVRTAQALRGAGYPGRITLASEETVLPYDKPPLSKAFLAGTATVDDVTLLTAADIEALDIDVRLGRRACRLHVADNAVEFNGGDRVVFDHLVIATGARARPSPWGQPSRTRSDYAPTSNGLDDSRSSAADSSVLRSPQPLAAWESRSPSSTLCQYPWSACSVARSASDSCACISATVCEPFSGSASRI